MKRITKPQDVHPFLEKIVALTPKSKYYGHQPANNIFNNGVVFAKIESIKSYSWGEFGIPMSLFLLKNARAFSVDITPTGLRQEDGFLDMRLATLEEVKQLKELLEKDAIKLA